MTGEDGQCWQSNSLGSHTFFRSFLLFFTLFILARSLTLQPPHLDMANIRRSPRFTATKPPQSRRREEIENSRVLRSGKRLYFLKSSKDGLIGQTVKKAGSSHPSYHEGTIDDRKARRQTTIQAYLSVSPAHHPRFINLRRKPKTVVQAQPIRHPNVRAISTAQHPVPYLLRT